MHACVLGVCWAGQYPGQPRVSCPLYLHVEAVVKGGAVQQRLCQRQLARMLAHHRAALRAGGGAGVVRLGCGGRQVELGMLMHTVARSRPTHISSPSTARHCRAHLCSGQLAGRLHHSLLQRGRHLRQDADEVEPA